MGRIPVIARVFILLGLLGFAAIACLAAGLLIYKGNTNTNLNPIESVILRVQLSTRQKDLTASAGADSTPVCFTVKQGDNASTIGATLKQQGFVNDAELFRIYARYYGIDANLQAGVYSLRRTLTIPEIAQILKNAGANTTRFQVIEGKRIEETIQAIDAANLSFRGSDFEALVGPGAASHADYLSAFAARYGIPADKSLEGFLFPDTYELPACSDANALVQRMIQNFDSRAGGDLLANASAQGLTPYQAVILASIVEREAVKSEERPTIASVYLNRLRKPMKLDADPTIQYALGNRRDPSTWWPNLTAADYTNINDIYNTYLNAGLPPSPIASPGLSSIEAVLHPNTTQYLYFRADCSGDGHHKFAVTFAEQSANGC